MDSAKSTADEGGLPAFDRPSLLERVMDDDELVAEIIASFIADTPGQIAALEEVFSRGDLAATERLAHRVKGAAANLSAVRLQRLASELETLARAGDRDRSAALVSRVGAEYSAAEAAMRASLETH